MVNLIGLVITVIIVIGVGGGGAYIIWLKTRPKKITWTADVYQLGEGIRPPIKDQKGNIISELRLSDLKPYTTDVIEKIEKEPGITIYRLIKLNKTVPEVLADTVDYWGEKNKRVSVLLDGDTCTLLKKGYDRDSGLIFNPMPHDRINMIMGQMSIRKDRLHKEKDILQAITPFIVIGISIMGLVAVVWIGIEGLIAVSDNIKEIAQMCSGIIKPPLENVGTAATSTLIAPPSVE